MQLTDNQRRVRIRDLNDTFRKTLDPTLGRVMLTAGVNALPSDVSAMAIREVATFDAFDDEMNFIHILHSRLDKSAIRF